MNIKNLNTILKFKTNIVEIDKIKRVLCFIIFNEVSRLSDDFFNLHTDNDLFRVSNPCIIKLKTLNLSIYSNCKDHNGYWYMFYSLEVNGNPLYYIDYIVKGDNFSIENEELFEDEDKIELSVEERFLVNILIREYLEYLDKENRFIDLEDVFNSYIVGDENNEE